MVIEPFFRWYDLWVGAFIDTKNQTVYICPVPCIGIKIVLQKESKGMDHGWLVVGAIIAAAIFIVGALCAFAAIIHAMHDLRAASRALDATAEPESHEDQR